jgi:hypothetical protein
MSTPDPLADPFASSSTATPTTNFGSSVSSPGSLSSTNLALPTQDLSALNDPNYFTAPSTNTGTLGQPTTGVNTGSGAGVGGGAGGSNTGANIGGLLGGLAPTLVAGGIGLAQASGAQSQNAQLEAQMAALGGPYTVAGQQLLKQWQSQQITPAQQNVVNTLNKEGATLESSAAPLSAIAQAAYQNYQSGTLPAADQLQLDNQVKSQKQQVAQQLASAGITDSTILAGQNAQIDNQAMITKQQLLDARFATGNVAYDQWLTATTQGQALQAEAAKFAATSLDNMLTQSLSLSAEGMAPIMQSIQLAIQSNAALSQQVNQLMGNLASSYAYSATGGKPPGTAGGGTVGALTALGSAAGKALGGGGTSGGGSSSAAGGSSTSALDPNYFNASTQTPQYDAYGNPITSSSTPTDPYAALNPSYFTDTSNIQPVGDLASTGPSTAGGVAATGGGTNWGTIGTAAGIGAGALGIYSGLQQGGAVGDTKAAVGATQLAGKAGLTSPGVNTAAGDLGNVLGIYTGIKQGGVSGYAGAAVNAAQLGASTGAFGGASQSVGQAAGYIAAPLDLYNEIKTWKSGATASDAMAGAETGAAVGSIIPGVGTLIGAVVGGIAGAVSSLFGSGKPGVASGNWNQLTASNALSSTPGRAFTETSWAEAFKGMLDEGNNIFAGGGADRHKNPDALAVPLEAQIKSGMKTLGPNATTDQVYNQVIVPWMQTSASGLNWSVLQNEPQQQLMIKSAVDRVLAGEPIVRAEMTGPDGTATAAPTSGAGGGGGRNVKSN